MRRSFRLMPFGTHGLMGTKRDDWTKPTTIGRCPLIPGGIVSDIENPDYHAMLSRMVTAYSKRIGDADPEDLELMVTLRAEVERAIGKAIATQRARYDRSWAEIARGVGTTREAAYERYADYRPWPE